MSASSCSRCFMDLVEEIFEAVCMMCTVGEFWVACPTADHLRVQLFHIVVLRALTAKNIG